MDKKILYLKAFQRSINSGLDTDESKLKTFYYLCKYMSEGKETEEDFYLSTLDEILLKGVCIKKFINYFPIKKEYDGEKYKMKDYFYTIKELQKYGDTIQDVQMFLWDYYNRDIMHYIVYKTSSMSKIRKNETGKGLLEEFFNITPLYLKEFNGQKVLYNSETAKTTPVKEYKRKPKWIKLVK